MEVLKFSKLCFTILGIFRFKQIAKPYGKLVSKFSFYFFFIGLGIFFAVNVTYLYQNFENFSQVPDLMISFVCIVASYSFTGSYISSIVTKKKKMENLNKELQEIVDSGKNQSLILWL